MEQKNKNKVIFIIEPAVSSMSLKFSPLYKIFFFKQPATLVHTNKIQLNKSDVQSTLHGMIF